MAVETPHMNNLLPSHQLLTNREMINLNNNHFYNPQMDGTSVPLSSSPFWDPNSMNKAVSGQRKRPRDNNSNASQPPFLDQNLQYQIHTHQSEIDRFIAQHTDKMLMELEQQQMRQSRALLSAIQDAMLKKMKEKDEEIQKIAKVNFVLHERVKSLCEENQIWRELALAHEAAAISLRSDLEQVLAHVSDGGGHRGAAAAEEEEDAESSCGSNHHREEEENDDAAAVGNLCRECGAHESVVLLLPCRHLCLCTTCGSTIRNCPLCHSAINASVHVNFS